MNFESATSASTTTAPTTSSTTPFYTKADAFTFGVPLTKSIYTNMLYQGEQPQGQYFQAQPQPQQAQKEYEQTHYYNLPMVVQQPYLQVSAASNNGTINTPSNPQQGPPPHGSTQYTMNQGIIYPSQQPFYETIPINNYLLIPQLNGAAGGNLNLYGGNFIQHQAIVQNQMQPQRQNQQSQQNQPIQHQQAIQQAPRPQVHQLVQAQASQAQSTQPKHLFAGFTEKLQELLPTPPLSKAAIRLDVNFLINQKRAKRKSKFTQRQDEMIVSLKRKGKSWVEIAEATQVGSYLAARNRYQVIVGQQGNNNSSSWTSDDKVLLRRLIDSSEIEKWKFIASELNKATGKNFTDKECRDFIKVMFWANPASFGANEDTLNECVKEKKITEKARDHEVKNASNEEVVYAEGYLKGYKMKRDASPSNETRAAQQPYAFNNGSYGQKRYY